MRIPSLLLLVVCTCAAADGVTVGQWGGMLMVTAPAGSGIGMLGGRLEQRITLDAREQPLNETADFLRRSTGLNVVVAPALLAKAPTVNLQVKDMNLGNLLRWIERTCAIHVGYVNGALYFSEQPVAGAPVVSLYDVRDLGMIIPDFPGPELTLPTARGGATVIPPMAMPERPTYSLDEVQKLVEQLVLKQQ